MWCFTMKNSEKNGRLFRREQNPGQFGGMRPYYPFSR